MLTGDETGWLLGDYVLSQIEPGEVTEHTVVASTVVSSRMLAAIAAAHGARHVETLTGFKWLSRADADLPGCTLVYAYEEAIGYCVDPSAVRDKDGISAAVLFCDMVVALREQGRTVLDALDDARPPPRCAHHDRGVAAGRRRRRGRGGDDPAAVQGADEAVRLRRHDDGSGGGAAVSATDRRGDSRRRRHAIPLCGWRSGRRAPSRKSSPTSRFGGTVSTAIWTPARADARRLSGGAGRNRRQVVTCASAARTAGRRHRRARERCRRCR